MNIINFKAIFAAIILSASILVGTGFMSGAAMAEDIEVEVLCFDTIDANGQEDVDCETVENLKAECALADPDSTTEVCQDADAASKRPANGLLHAPDRVDSLTDGENGPPTTRK